MKQGKTLSELALEVQTQHSLKKDFVAPTTQMRVDVIDRKAVLTVEDFGQYPIKDHALTQIAERVGIPTKYLRKMQDEAPQLLSTNINTWFDATPERRMVRTLAGNQRAFLSDRYARTDAIDVLQVALPEFSRAGVTVRSCELTENRLYVKAVFDGLTREVKSSRVGDMVKAGLMVSTSEIGMGATQVTPWAEFTLCTNGMVREGGKRWAHLGKRIGGEDAAYLTDETVAQSDKLDLMVIRDTIRAALDPKRFEEWIASLQETTQRRITGSVEKGIQLLATKLTLVEGEKNSVLRHLIEGGDLSQYGLLNAVTRTAEDATDYDRATELEAAGQRVLELSPSEWRVVAEAA